MSWVDNDMQPVESVLREGLCTPNCLLALESDDNRACSCRCCGAYHGALAEAVVVRGKANRKPNNWWNQDEVVKLDHDEYVDMYEKGTWEYNRIYRASHGKFGAVLKNGASMYSVKFEFVSFKPNGCQADFDKIERLLNALLMSKRISGYNINSDCLGDFGSSYLDPCVDFFVGGIRKLDEAKVIHNVFLDFCYTPYGLNLDNQIERVKRYARSKLSLEISADCTSAKLISGSDDL